MASRGKKKQFKPLPSALPSSKRVSREEFGFTGTVILSGFIIGEEYNADLSGKKGMEVWEKMRRGDATVAASLKAVKLPILGADWFMEPASDSDEDVMIRDAAEFTLFKDCETSFYDLLRQALNMLDYGFQPFELVWKTTEFVQQKEVMPDAAAADVPPGPVGPVMAGDLPVAAPAGPPMPMAQKPTPVPTIVPQAPVTLIGLKKIGFRKPSSVYKWETEDGQPGITQRARDGRTASVPMDRLVIFTNDREGDNFEGISILRPAYKHWYMKDAYYKIAAMKAERQGLGVPKVKMPSGVQKGEKDKAEEILRNLRANEGGYMSVPEDYDVEFMDMHASSTYDLMNDINHHDRQIMFNVLAAFLEMGSHGGSGGAKASSEDHQKLFQQSLEAIAKNLQETINKYVIQRFVDLNFPGAAYPEVRFEKISVYDILEYGQAVAAMVNSGVLTADKTLEASTRDAFNMPVLPDNPEYNMPQKAAQPMAVQTSADPEDLGQEEKVQNIDDDPTDRNASPSPADTNPVKASEAETLLSLARQVREAMLRTAASGS